MNYIDANKENFNNKNFNEITQKQKKSQNLFKELFENNIVSPIKPQKNIENSFSVKTQKDDKFTSNNNPIKDFSLSINNSSVQNNTSSYHKMGNQNSTAENKFKWEGEEDFDNLQITDFCNNDAIDFDSLFTSLEQSINQTYKQEARKPANSFYDKDPRNTTTFNLELGNKLGPLSKIFLYKNTRT